MSAQDFNKGDRVEYIDNPSSIDRTPSLIGKTGTVVGPTGSEKNLEVRWDDRHATPKGVLKTNLRKVGPEWTVGQKVSGDDYVRLPVGSVVLEEEDDAAVKSVPLAKTGADEWTNQGYPGVFASADLSYDERTLTRLGDGIADVEIEPKPPKPGDWVPVWAEFVKGPDEDGDVQVRIRARDGSPIAGHVRSDAIVRPVDGQVPPWVKPAQCPSLKDMSDSVRIQCAKDANVLVHMHRAVYAGVEVRWPDDEAYGRVEVSS